MSESYICRRLSADRATVQCPVRRSALSPEPQPNNVTSTTRIFSHFSWSHFTGSLSLSLSGSLTSQSHFDFLFSVSFKFSCRVHRDQLSVRPSSFLLRSVSVSGALSQSVFCLFISMPTKTTILAPVCSLALICCSRR